MNYRFGQWTPSDDVRLRELWAAKVPTRDIAAKLGRTGPAVYERTKVLNLPRRKGGGPRSEASAYKTARPVAVLNPRGRNFSSEACMRALSDLFDARRKAA